MGPLFSMANKILIFISKITRLICRTLERVNEYGKVNDIKKLGRFGTGVVIYSTSKIANAQRDVNKLEVGDNTRIDGIIQVFPYGNGLKIGNNCYIGSNSRIWAADRIEIGNNVLISHGVNIMDTDSHETDYMLREKSAAHQLKNGLPKTNTHVKTAPIFIKDNAWISYNVSILKGVTIGRGAIIGCGAVVTHDIPDFTLAVGNPARVIKTL